ncbi:MULTISPECIES: transaldolase family protein [unclassified Streptomyces]|uniref:transaldolase family protein n=1 Tax=unclassified Streptomyces TaxID=2593676 RepID=UPI0038133782
MTLFLDSADTSRISDLAKTGAITGVTMNPALMRPHTDDPLAHLIRVLKAAGGDRTVMYQPTNAYGTARDEALRAHETDPRRVVVKIPAVRASLPLAEELARQGVPVALTAALGPAHMMLAETVGAKYLIPYVDRSERDIRGCPDLVRELVRLRTGPVVIVAASLKNLGQALRARADGADAVSVPAEVIDTILDHPMSTEAALAFDSEYAHRRLPDGTVG